MILARVSHPAHFGGRGSSRFILGRVPLIGLLLAEERYRYQRS